MRHAPAKGCAPPRRTSREGGHLLIVLMVMITVFLIFLTVAAQSWTFRIKREMEIELIFRGEQYVQGLNLYRQATGGWPIGDLKVLVRRGPGGVRFMRKDYRNPLDKKGEWQHLFLHPGGSGFINPCANAAAGMAAFLAGGPAQGSAPIAGFPLGQAGNQAVTGMPLGGGGLKKGSAGLKSASGLKGGGGVASQLSAIDPKTFNQSGMAQMNLPIVGVVNCEQRESIRRYKGQTWLANWAFTPLAQGEFGGKAIGGVAAGGPAAPKSGLGLSGQVYAGDNIKNMPGYGGSFDLDNRTDPRRRGQRNFGGRAVVGAVSDDEEEDRDRWRRDDDDEDAEDEDDDWDDDDEDDDWDDDDEDDDWEDEDDEDWGDDDDDDDGTRP